MNIEHYNALAKNAGDSMGIQLPKVTVKTLVLKTEEGDFACVQKTIDALKPTEGWVLMTNGIIISPATPQSTGLIEAEYVQGESSLKIVLLSGNRYQITHFSSQIAQEESDYCFTQQEVVLRQSLQAQASSLWYRIWYQKADHRWRPIAQQFMGFNTSEGNA